MMKIHELPSDVFHQDFPTIPSDTELGKLLAQSIGDTWIECKSMSPVAQWTTIVKALRVHWLKIETDKGEV